MERIRALVPWTFFGSLLPFNAELLNGNAMLVRACGAKRTDGSILRSKSYVLFGNGVATLLPQAKVLAKDPNSMQGYVMEFVQKRDGRQVDYWEAQSVPDQNLNGSRWQIEISEWEPDSDDGEHIINLVGQHGNPGQYFYLGCTA